MRENSSPTVNEDRRGFLKSAAATGAAAMLSGSLLSACATAISYRGDLSNGRVRIPAQQLSLIADQPGLLVDAPGLPEKIWLIRAEDEWLAIGAQCTHLKCQVRPRGGFISCNCHGSTFQIDGRVIRGPASKPLRRYVVQVVKTLTDDTTHDVEIMIQ
ncbi:MAG: Rieske (2Fe-2S) protein [Gemmatimonadetes bacterium]|nr:Rieske (2Fe-2S) protein [Gemmatimonadota bacterium]